MDAEAVLGEYFASSQEWGGKHGPVKLDGYFTALAIGPNLVMPSTWMPRLLETSRPMRDLEDAQRVVAAIMERYNGVLRALDTEGYRPTYLPDDPKRAVSRARAEAWAQGFFEAMMLDPEWLEMTGDDDGAMLLAPILMLVTYKNGERLIEFTDAEIKDELAIARTTLALKIKLIQTNWKIHAEEKTLTVSTADTNARCSCGSGKKYKQCCGLN